MNGKNGLACITPISALNQPGKKIVIRPLPGLPVIRDLVVDMGQFYAQYEKIKPYLLNNGQNPPAREHLQMPEQREKLDGLYECILCACCSTSCPSFWWNPDKFIGPAGLLAAYRFPDRQSRYRNQRAPGRPERCFQRIPLSQHYELRQCVSEGAEPDARHRPY